MNSLRAVADPTPEESGPTVPLASWYTQSVSDGFGDRLLMSDNTSTSSLELLRFRPELASAPGFARALRESVDRLADFDHPAFARVRAVTELEGEEGGLALVSTHMPGRRLSEIFHGSRQGSLHPAFVAWLIRWLTPALADLRDQTGEPHGAITPERIVLAPDGRPVFVESVLGRSIEQLRLSSDGVWRLFGVIVPPRFNRSVWLDDSTDVFQLASVCLSLLLGRRVTPAELEARLDDLLQEFTTSDEGRASSLTPALCLWLERALRVEGGFKSAREASEDIAQLSQAPRPDMRRLHARVDRTLTFGGLDRSAFERDGPDDASQDLSAARRLSTFGAWFSARGLAVACATVALAEGVVIAMLLAEAPGDVGLPLLPVRIQSSQAGDIVMLDGHEVGVTPLDLTIGASMQTISIVSALPQAPLPTLSEGASPLASGPASRVDPVPPSPVPPTGIRLISPIELQVLDGSRVIGSSLDPRIALGPGRYQLEFVNDGLGYRSTQAVEVRSGEIRAIEVQPPGGRMSVNAMPWAQVWLDGTLVGETPLAFLPVSAGEHEVVFRHPELGERRETLTMKSGGETRISVSFSP